MGDARGGRRSRYSVSLQQRPGGSDGLTIETSNEGLGRRLFPRVSRTVLVVEDEVSLGTLARRVLARAGYTVLEARNGVEGLKVSEQHQGPLDLVITDVVMPKLSGPRMAERLARMRPDTKILYMSGYAHGRTLGDLLDTQAPLLEKPFTIDALLGKVEEILGTVSAES